MVESFALGLTPGCVNDAQMHPPAPLALWLLTRLWSVWPAIAHLASSITYSYEADATFSGAANLRWIGHPPMVSGSVSDGEARDLAGEAFSVPWVTAIVITILGNPFAQWTLHPLHRQPLWALLRPHASRPVPPVFRRPPGEVD